LGHTFPPNQLRIRVCVSATRYAFTVVFLTSIEDVEESHPHLKQHVPVTIVKHDLDNHNDILTTLRNLNYEKGVPLTIRLGVKRYMRQEDLNIIGK
jgi:hypothetical protein